MNKRKQKLIDELFNLTKNTYQLMECDSCSSTFRCVACMDCTDCAECTLCSDCIYCFHCVRCVDCRNCAFCYGLKHKRHGYWLHNKEVTREEFALARKEALHMLEALRRKSNSMGYRKNIARLDDYR